MDRGIAQERECMASVSGNLYGMDKYDTPCHIPQSSTLRNFGFPFAPAEDHQPLHFPVSIIRPSVSLRFPISIMDAHPYLTRRSAPYTCYSGLAETRM